MPLTSELAAILAHRGNAGDFTPATRQLIEGLMLSLGDDAEAWLTYLLSKSPYLADHEQLRNRAAGLELANAIAEVICDAQSLVEDTSYPQWVQDLALHWNKNCVDIVTLNYDTLVELLLATHRDPENHVWGPSEVYRYPMRSLATRSGGGMFGGQVDRAPVQLLKLHGSTNWFRDDVPLTAQAGQTYLGPMQATRNREQLGGVGVRPLILPPAYTKGDFYDLAVIRSQWTAARDAIQYADRLVIVGTSLRAADWDLTQLLITGVLGPAGGVERESHIKPKEVILVNPDERPAKRSNEILRQHVEHRNSVEELLATFPPD